MLLKNMKITNVALGLAFCSFHISAGSQVSSTVVGPPYSCRNSSDDIEVHYIVRNHFRNEQNKTVMVKIGKEAGLSFLLFRGRETTDPSAAVYQANPDSLTPPAVTRHALRPGQSVEWTRTAVILTRDWDSSDRLPHTGEYSLLPFPDIQLEGESTSPTDKLTKGQWLPIRIPEVQSNVPRCRQGSLH
jgi:hypothetical protein